ncbi:hypothetical protein [Actinomadura rayongensis]|uniref:Uncharacterized protein n=1 Tax=Actinomadura rayongensis TaxID=1429076 RepID=A0A6I4W4Q0_9ACTN|nr:hypothetical protein [Actinomadura rayongensis]MXQ64428.1 hypothetical protein [Actinomadura rayongensis]
MRINDLNEEQQRVFAAVVALEGEGAPGFVEDVAGRAGIDPDEARRVVHELLDPPGLVHEVPSTPDMGPEYRTKPHT